MTPMTLDTDFDIAAAFAPHVWGPTGFRCDHCQHERGWHLTCRPRVWECEACGHQQSVVAGTLMADTKLPLRVWLLRGEYYARGEVPTCSRFALEAGVARSTVWLLNHKVFAALAGAVRETFALTAACRRPRRALGPMAPEDLRAVWKALREGRTRGATVHLGEALRVTMIQDHPEHPLGRRISQRLERVHRRVCVRWLGRWVAHFVDLFGPGSSWLARLLGHPPKPMRVLDPYQQDT